MSLKQPVEDLAADLGEAIAELPEYETFEAAKDSVAADEAAQAKIDAFERRREEFVAARRAGEATQDDFRELRRSQQELHEIPVMADYLEAQADLEERLETLNLAISEPLAIDFGETAGGCCQD